jgi:predicted PurR-regulated permease PerM
MNSELNKEKNRLNRLIREKKAEITVLESKTSDLESLVTKRNRIKSETEELESFINSSIGQKQTLIAEIGALTTQKSELDNYIQINTPVKQTLTTDLKSLNSQKTEIVQEIEQLETTKSTTQEDVNQITQEKGRLDGLIIELREKYGLYSKDMKDMSQDSITQLKKYSWSAVSAIIGVIILMIILLCILTNSDPFSENLMKFFYQEPNLRFYSILTIRISISAVFIFFIIIFLNLSRGFVSQYIKARNRLTALRVADFLIGRIQSKKNIGSTEEERMKIETERIKEQVELLNNHIPKIMDLGSSSFDKTSRTKDPLEQLKEMKEIIR